VPQSGIDQPRQHPGGGLRALDPVWLRIRKEAEDVLERDFRCDLIATFDRDPATERFIQPLLYFKGFHAIQTHRLAHWLWRARQRDLATGLVVGETALIEDDVSMLHGVTLGGTGNESGERHPKIRRGVLIGAGAKILGNIEVGACSRVAAGSVVVHPVPRNVTVAGVPARVIGEAGCTEPSRTMDQLLSAGAAA
jgi:serine O-acetyltransferase